MAHKKNENIQNRTFSHILPSSQLIITTNRNRVENDYKYPNFAPSLFNYNSKEEAY